MESIGGTRDFFPNEMSLHNWLINHWKKISEIYGFQEYDAPIVESATLYTRKGGDDILKEMFTIKDGTSIIALRPEMTPSVVRMVMQYLKSSITPIKWYSVPQCWRNETVTRGRRREFYQWNVDIFGAEYCKSDVEILAIIVHFFKEIGLTSNDIVIKVSNRMILQKFFGKFGVSDDKILIALNIVDKINKKTREEITEILVKEINLDLECINKLYELISVTDINKLNDYFDENDFIDFFQFFDLIKAYEINDWIQFDVSIVRGLSYYTGIVFEAFFKNIDLKRAICGGGRYDNLLESYGYPEKVPCVGFGLGDVVIIEGLKELHKLPVLTNKCDYCIIPFKDLYCEAIKIAQKLRYKGYRVDLYMSNDKKMKNAFSYADRINAEQVIFVAPDELTRNSVRIKHLRDKSIDQKEVKLDDLLS